MPGLCAKIVDACFCPLWPPSNSNDCEHQLTRPLKENIPIDKVDGSLDSITNKNRTSRLKFSHEELASLLKKQLRDRGDRSLPI